MYWQAPAKAGHLRRQTPYGELEQVVRHTPFRTITAPKRVHRRHQASLQVHGEYKRPGKAGRKSGRIRRFLRRHPELKHTLRRLGGTAVIAGGLALAAHHQSHRARGALDELRGLTRSRDVLSGVTSPPRRGVRLELFNRTRRMGKEYKPPTRGPSLRVLVRGYEHAIRHRGMNWGRKTFNEIRREPFREPAMDAAFGGGGESLGIQALRRHVHAGRRKALRHAYRAAERGHHLGNAAIVSAGLGTVLASIPTFEAHANVRDRRRANKRLVGTKLVVRRRRRHS